MICGNLKSYILCHMKRLALSVLAVSMACCVMAQSVEYQAFIYTSDELSEEIQRETDALGQRSIFGDMLGATTNALSGMATGYITSFVDLGINAIGSLITRKARQKAEWEETVQKENVYETTIRTVSNVNDFYEHTSTAGAMDPKGMKFDGIGCLRMDGQDTVFYISCHIDRSKLYRIVNHSKFQLVLDTLIISPERSNLPNSELDIPFSFKERRNFNLTMNIKLISSWMNEIVQLQKDVTLGEFSISVPVDTAMLDGNGFLRYVRPEGEPSAFSVIGESFIVPRSYMPYRDANDEFHNSWGTGEYKLEIGLKETCDITDYLRENWKDDRKRREKLQPSESLLTRGWQMVTTQKWDEITKSWVITTLKAPAGVLTNEMLEKMGLPLPVSSQAGAQTQQGGQQQAMPKK